MKQFALLALLGFVANAVKQEETATEDYTDAVSDETLATLTPMDLSDFDVPIDTATSEPQAEAPRMNYNEPCVPKTGTCVPQCPVASWNASTQQIELSWTGDVSGCEQEFTPNKTVFVAYSDRDFATGNITIDDSVIAEQDSTDSGVLAISGYDGVYKFTTANDAWEFGEEYTIAAFYQETTGKITQYSIPVIAEERLVVPAPTQ